MLNHLRSLPVDILRALRGTACALLAILTPILTSLFGKISWNAPPWAGCLIRSMLCAKAWAQAHRRIVAATLAIIIVGAGAGYYGYRWWQAQPKPVSISFKITAPTRTEIENDGEPKPLRVEFSGSVAPLALVGKPVSSGIELSPNIAGSWKWQSERILEFIPKEDWPIGLDVKAQLAKALFSPQTRLAAYEFKFKTASFEIKPNDGQFYQDPVNPGIKQAVFEVNFSHPVNAADFEKRIELQMEGQSSGVLGLGKETTHFTVSYDKLKLNAYIRSASLPIPKEATSLKLTLAKGIAAIRSSNPSENDIVRSVRIPGLYSLDVSSIESQVVNNERDDPEQVLTLQSSMAVHEKDMAHAISVWVLPAKHPKKEKNAEDGSNYNWDNLEDITPDVLKVAQKLNLEAIAAEREFTETHAYKFKADVGRTLFIQVEKNLRAFGGYLLGERVQQTMRVRPFPSQLKFLSEGALLTLSGEKKIPILVRDLPGVRMEIGRVLPSQLQHLVSQSGGSFTRPDFMGTFGPDNLAERFERKIPLELKRGKAHYEALDLGSYLKSGNEEKRGIFLISVEGYDPKNENSAQAAPVQHDSEESEGEEGGGEIDNSPPNERRDRRLIVVTDLGILTKRSSDGSQDVFIQSIHSGLPVAGASVEVIGRNGIAVTTQTTDIAGRAHFDKLEGYSRERAPLMYLVKKGGDMSFLPLNRSDRRLDYSRFDIGGVDNARTAEQLNAYLFSDRGMYRPGEEIRIGMIIKAADWAKKITGLPLEVEVVDSRGLVVKREKIKVGEGGFNELSHPTQESSPTGTYTINLYIVKDGKANQQIGSTTVRVQEFLPDRMKASVHLSKETDEGWVHPKDLKAKVNVQNLFGTPAEKRRVEAVLTLTPAYPAFRSFPDYQFYDPNRAKEGVSEKLAEQSTDAEGNAEFVLGLERFDKASYRLHLLARAFEPEGGRSVAAETAVLVSEQAYLIGYKPDGDLAYVSHGSKRSVSVIAIGPNAKKTAVQNLTLKLYERKVVSVLTRQGNGNYRYESRNKDILLKETPLAIAAGGHALPLATDAPGNFAYAISDDKGLEYARVAYSVAGTANVSRSLERNAELQLTLNKKDYQPGEEIEISIRAPYTGAGLITIEREKIYSTQWFKTGTTATVQKIRLPKDFEGNGYISVHFIRDPGSDEIYTSPLSYGVIPFATSLSQRTNPLTLTAPELIKPGQTLHMKLTSKQPTRAVVFAVDEGILQVARYTQPDPLGYFFQKRRLEVSTTQILDLILPEFKKLITAAAPGGDAEGALGKHLNPFKRKRDKPAVYWSGIVDVKDSADFSYTVPDTFNGTLRLMAVAVNDESIGVAQNKAIVRGDFVLTPNTPLAVAPGDEFEVSVGVANNVHGSGANAALNLSLKTSAHFDIVGEASRSLTVGEMREGVALFRLKARDGERASLGSGTLSFNVALGNKNSKLNTDISVRPATPNYTSIRVGAFKGSLDLPVQRNLHAEFRQTEASISPLPLAAVSGLSAYLGNFAHLCTEQLVSQAIPNLILGKRPEFAGKSRLPGKSMDEVIRVLRTRQNSEGGFGLWDAAVRPAEFASVYAAHLLLEARERGETVPTDMLQKNLNYLQQYAASRASDLHGARSRAYAIYLLTRQGMVTTALLASLRETLEARYTKEWRNDLTAAYLATSYQLLKQEKPAAELIGPLTEQLGKRLEAPFQHANYYDPLIHETQVVYLLSRHFPQRARTLSPAVWTALMQPIERGRFNTLSAAYTILALDAYASLIGPEALANMSISEVDKNGKTQPLALSKGLVGRAPFSATAAKLALVAGNDMQHYYGISESGFDRVPPTSEERAGMEIFREYLDAKGNPLKSLKLGEEVTVRLRLRGIERSVANIAVVDLLPGGLEPVLQPPPAVDDNDDNSGKPATDRLGGRGSWSGEAMDIREDRIVLYGSVGRDMAEYTYRAKAVAAGTFVVPPAYAESLYEREVRARTPAGSLNIERASK